MITHADIYDEPEKQAWREHIVNMVNRKNCHSLVDENNKLRYKWLEPLGKDALPLAHLLSTDRLKEEQFIGIDLDPKNHAGSIQNIENCKLKYPKASLLAQDWCDFCYTYNGNDIGVVVLDLYLAQGEHYEALFDATLQLLEKSKRSIGEVYFVSNTVFGGYQKDRANAESLSQFIQEQFQKSGIREFRELKVTKDNIYEYTSKKIPMATFVMVL